MCKLRTRSFRPRWTSPGRLPCSLPLIMFINIIMISSSSSSIRVVRGALLPWDTTVSWVALFVQRYLSNTASFVLCVFRRVKEHHNLLHDSTRLKKTCVRQVVLDKWFPLKWGSCFVVTCHSFRAAKLRCTALLAVPDTEISNQWNRNPQPQLEPQITSLEKCKIS